MEEAEIPYVHTQYSKHSDVFYQGKVIGATLQLEIKD